MKLSRFVLAVTLADVTAQDAERGSPKKNFGSDLANPRTWNGLFDGKDYKIAAKIGRTWRKLDDLLKIKYRFCENIEGTPAFERSTV